MEEFQFTSVIVPAYNAELFIGRCLRSLLNQTVNHDTYEIIIIDDGSVDKTSYAVSQFKNPKNSNIRLLKNNNNIGLPSSLNKGVSSSKGEYIVRVDSDDYVSCHFIEFLRFYLDSNENADAVACDYLVVNDNEKVILRQNSFNNPIGCGIMFRRQPLIECGLYDPEFLCHEEREMRFRFEKKYAIERLQLPLYRYRQHVNGITQNKSLMKGYKEKLILKHGHDASF